MIFGTMMALLAPLQNLKLIVLEEEAVAWEASGPTVYIVQASEDAGDACLELARELRRAGISTLTDLEARKMAAQLKQADKSGAKFAVILGSEEMSKGQVILRYLASSGQVEVPRSEIASKILADPAMTPFVPFVP